MAATAGGAGVGAGAGAAVTGDGICGAVFWTGVALAGAPLTLPAEYWGVIVEEAEVEAPLVAVVDAAEVVTVGVLDEALGDDSAGVGDGYFGGATGTEPGNGSWDVWAASCARPCRTCFKMSKIE